MAHAKAVLLQQYFVSLRSLFSLTLLYFENATLWSVLINGQTDRRVVTETCIDRDLCRKLLLHMNSCLALKYRVKDYEKWWSQLSLLYFLQLQYTHVFMYQGPFLIILDFQILLPTRRPCCVLRAAVPLHGPSCLILTCTSTGCYKFFLTFPSTRQFQFKNIFLYET